MGWVAQLADAISPWAQILGFLAIIGGLVVYARKLIRWLRQQFRESRAATNRAEAATRETSTLITTLIQELEEEKQLRAAETDARTREADRNDKVFTALLESQAAARNFIKWVARQDLPKRVSLLEEFAAERETEEHITGRLRLHEMAPTQETDV